MSDRAAKWNNWTKQKTAGGRNGLIGKVHVAKTQLAMTDDSYRAMLERITGKSSCGSMSVSEIEKVLEEFARLGFKAKGGKRAGTRKQADDEQAGKIRALWLNLYHLGELDDPSEEALGAFVKRSCKVTALQWIDTKQGDTVINALRGWLQRIGFFAPNAATVELLSFRRGAAKIDDGNYFIHAIAWKVCVIAQQMKLLGFDRDSFDPCLAEASKLDDMIEYLGGEVRKLKAGKSK